MTLPTYIDAKNSSDQDTVARTVVYNGCQIAVDFDPDGNVVGVEIVSGEPEA